MNEPVKNTFILAFGNGMSKILGFVREMVIAAFFGASALVDAYLVAQTIPSILFSVVNSAIATTALPLVTEYEEKEGRKSVLIMLNTITTGLILLVVLLIIIGEAFAVELVHLIAPGFNGATAQTAVTLTRVLMPAILFMGLAGIATGILQSQKRFLYPAMIGIPFNLLIISFVIITAKTWGIMGLAVGTLLGIAAQWLVQVPDLRRSGFRFRPQMMWSHPGFRKMWVLTIPVLIGTGAAQINLMVDRMMASGLAAGSIAALGYASKLYTLITGVLTVAIANAVYPEFSQSVVGSNMKQYARTLVRALNAICLIIIPAAIGMLVLREPIISLLFERGAFDATATTLTATALFFFCFGLPAIAMQDVVLRAFYSLQDTWTPMYVGLVTVGLNIIFILLFVGPLKVGGLALATSLSTTVGLMLLVYFLRKKVGPLGGTEIATTGGKISAASLVMGAVVYVIYHYMQSIVPNGTWGDFIIVMINMAAGIIVYYTAVRLLHITEVEWVVERVRCRLRLAK